jgi:hypothetical protein
VNPATGGVQQYLDALVDLCARSDRPVPAVSVIVFGSAAVNGFTESVSDVDSIVVLDDVATRADQARLSTDIQTLEISHGFRPAMSRKQTSLEAFAERSGGNALSSFVCRRSDLLAGDVGKVLGLRAAEAAFVDRIVFANIIASAVTVWGEDLLPRVPVPAVRRTDVFKALFSFSNQVLLSIAGFAVLPNATKYAMGALKRSLHSCFFCYRLHSAALDEEVAFFSSILGPQRTLTDLLALRREYQRSFGFVVRCLPMLVRLHLRTARDNAFPLSASAPLPFGR